MGFDWVHIETFVKLALAEGWGWLVIALILCAMIAFIIIVAYLRGIHKRLDTLQAITLKESWNQFD